MGIHKERILPISYIRILQTFFHPRLLLLTHARQYIPLLPIQPIITHPRRHTKKDLRHQTRDDRNLPTLVAWRFTFLKCLSSQNNFHAERHERESKH
jgi:hypothetical protein